MTDDSAVKTPVVGLFATCAVDLIRPAVGFASAALLEDAGCTVTVPEQSCCGQVAWNNGLGAEARVLARQLMAQFADVDYVVVPSGSCASMLKNHYPTLFSNPQDILAAQEFAGRVYELTCFLRDVLDYRPSPAQPTAGNEKKVVYHDSCAGLRELGIRTQPRDLLASLGVTVVDPQDCDVCCGFGGTFCVKFEDISAKMVADKARNIAAQAPDVVLGGDLTCLLNIAGKLQRDGHDHIDVRHVAEYLADATQHPAIGHSE
ncbi:MAG: (Fe-S)-binding protein [Porticoccaceae bacterium]